MKFFALVFTTLVVAHQNSNGEYNENTAREFIKKFNEDKAEWATKKVLAEWNHVSNLTEENRLKSLEVTKSAAKFNKEAWLELLKFPWKNFQDEDVKRQFKLSASIGVEALPEDKVVEFTETVDKMETIYSTAKICDYHDKNKCDLALEPELVKLLRESRDPEELKHIWISWRNAVGPKCKSHYQRYVELANEASKINGFKDRSDEWLQTGYESDKIENDLEELWNQLRPLYLQLHSYIRHRLVQKYGPEVVPKDGPIPAHLLGNMWAQTWEIDDFVLPYPPRENSPNVTKAMIDQGYTIEKMFKVAEDFFVSLNLSAMTDSFWKLSILEKPKDREMVCHASAWDFFDGKDFRIKMCTIVNDDHLETVHHEMGHIEYFMQYKDLPMPYKQGANPGFHEAIGDLITLSAFSTKHLKKIGLRQSEATEKEEVINDLMFKALRSITFLPFSYLMDKYRWNIFRGVTKPESYNSDWWKLRMKYQGIEPPVERSENDFDPASKYHVVADVEYSIYFVARVLQFQFYETLCIKAGEYNPEKPETKPLHECDFYNNKEAGNALKNMLALGASKPWPEVLETLTGQRKMDARPLMEYFKPLNDWLVEENKKNGLKIGWESSSRVPGSTSEGL